MFVDASAIVAILTEEADADALATVLEGPDTPITSAVAVFEAALGLRRERHASFTEAQEDVRDFLAAAGIRTVPLGAREADLALTAFDRYGKGRGHPAQLNLGDCFAYAAARAHGTTLLFKGDDSAKTVIATATAPSGRS